MVNSVPAARDCRLNAGGHTGRIGGTVEKSAKARPLSCPGSAHDPDHAHHPHGATGEFPPAGLVLTTAPLGLIGVVAALLIAGAPMGFIAILGIVSLAGMVIRNSVILVTRSSPSGPRVCILGKR